MADYQRQTAHLCRVSELKEGSYKKPENMLAGGVITERGLLSRVNILGIVVEKPSENRILLDDGSTNITCRRFDEIEIDADVGDMVLVVGKPREFNDERYIVLEICKRLSNKNWAEYRKKELELLMGTTIVELVPETSPDKPEEPKEPVDENPVETIINSIRKLDKGQGADMQQVVSAIDKGEQIVKTLLEEGEIFEIKPGRLKVLE